MTSRSQCLALLVSYPDGLAAMAGLTRTMMVLATRGQDWAERTRRLVWKLVVVIQRRRPENLNLSAPNFCPSQLAALTHHGRRVRRERRRVAREQGERFLTVLNLPR